MGARSVTFILSCLLPLGLALAASPTVQIVYPTPGFVSIGPILVPARAEASDPDGPADVHRVEFFLNALTNQIAVDYAAPYECVLTNTSGAYTLGVRVYDFASNSMVTSLTYSVAAPAAVNQPGNTNAGFLPLPTLGTNTYRGFQGGLYPGGANDPPPAHTAAGLALAGQMVPLDAAGLPNPTGKIVVIGLGYSNAQQLFAKWLQLFNGVQASNVVFVNGALGGQVASNWANASDPVWTNHVLAQLATNGVTTNQVQAVYDMMATRGDTWVTQAWPLAATYLQSNLETVARLQLTKFPRLKLSFWMTREYGGYAGGNLNPEPIAYETGFAIKGLIERQVTNDLTLNFNPSNGPVVAAWMAWGPYTWANGLVPRYDGLTYTAADFTTTDGVHPSDPAGRTKLAQQLLVHMQYSPFTKDWFNPPSATPGSAFASITLLQSGVSVGFGSGLFVRYDLQTAPDPAGAWTTQSVLFGTGTNQTVSLAATNTRAVYRLEAKSGP